MTVRDTLERPRSPLLLSLILLASAPATWAGAGHGSGPDDGSATGQSSAPRTSAGSHWIGVQTVDPADEGVRIGRVVPDTPADRADLQSGDRLRRIASRRVDSLADLRSAVDSHGNESGLTVVFDRQGDRQTVDLTPMPRPDRPGTLTRRLVGSQLPTLELRFSDVEATSTDDLPEKPLVIEFWTTWCPPCDRSARTVERMGHRHGGELLIVAVTPEGPSAIDSYRREHPHSPVSLARDPDQSAHRALFIDTYPTLMLVGADREIRGVYVGVERLDDLREAAAQLPALR